MERNKRFIVKTWLLAFLCAILMTIIGSVFSIWTGFEANDHSLFIRALVWSCDIVVSYILTWLLFLVGKTKIPFFSKIAWGLSICLGVIIVGVLTDSLETGFCSVFSAVVPIVGYIVSLLKEKEEKKKTNKKQKRHKRK